jgi:hypothetical protein
VLPILELYLEARPHYLHFNLITSFTYSYHYTGRRISRLRHFVLWRRASKVSPFSQFCIESYSHQSPIYRTPATNFNSPFVLFVSSLAANGLSIVGWRDVPVDESVLGILSKDFVPTIRQVPPPPSSACHAMPKAKHNPIQSRRALERLLTTSKVFFKAINLFFSTDHI